MRNEKISFDQGGIEAVFKRAEGILFDPVAIYSVVYQDFEVRSFDRFNQDFLAAINQKSIVYCLWAGVSPVNLNYQYIGHVAAPYARQRIRNHLCRKHNRTGAQLPKVEAVLQNKGVLGISFVEVEPDYMRKALEEWLIANNKEQLAWNIAGKRHL